MDAELRRATGRRKAQLTCRAEGHHFEWRDRWPECRCGAFQKVQLLDTPLGDSTNRQATRFLWMAKPFTEFKQRETGLEDLEIINHPCRHGEMPSLSLKDWEADRFWRADQFEVVACHRETLALDLQTRQWVDSYGQHAEETRTWLPLWRGDCSCGRTFVFVGDVQQLVTRRY